MCLQPAFKPWRQTLRDSVLQIERGLLLFLILPRVVFFDQEEGTPRSGRLPLPTFTGNWQFGSITSNSHIPIF